MEPADSASRQRMNQSANPFWTGGRWLLLGVMVAVAGAWPAAAADGDRQLGTIGPPPRKSPQRQSSAEALGPADTFPTPSSNLRRSELKAEPQAPLLAGKLTYGTYQDYMPNPGDLDNLMRYIRTNLGLWYGQRLVKIEEVVAGRKAGRPCPIPLLRSRFTIKEVHDRRTGSVRPLELLGLKLKDRLVVVYSRNDAITQLKQVSDPYGNGYDAESCRQLAVNIVAYAMQN